MKKKTLDESSHLKLGNTLDGFIKKLFGVGILGLIVCLYFMFTAKSTFYFSYLTSFTFFLSLSLGGMFIVLIHHITRSGWSVVIRRLPEGFMANVGLMGLFAIPIFFGMHELYHWTHHDAVAHDHLLQIKAPYLNIVFFVIRMIFYFLVWRWISNTFFKGSVEQDENGDEDITFKLQKRSTVSIMLFALTVTFGSIDLIMSITPHWYSTIFGVYFFAGAVLVAYCFISVIFMFLRTKGLLKDIVNLEHYHDLGKLIYGFNIFWSYIGFSQFFLIWYANVPEETLFYVDHFMGSWNNVAILLMVGHFGIPFVFLLSRHVKRNLVLHCMFAVWLIFMHFVDLYWIIMPNIFKEGISVTFIDLFTFLGIGGIFFGVFFNRLKKHFLIPIKDPRLSEGLNFENF